MMFNVMQEVNWFAVVLAALASALLGGVWFTMIFGKAYALALGREGTPSEKPDPLLLRDPLYAV